MQQRQIRVSSLPLWLRLSLLGPCIVASSRCTGTTPSQLTPLSSPPSMQSAASNGPERVRPRSFTLARNPLIQHIVVIMQENRSFDNLFEGFPGADTAKVGDADGISVPLQQWSLATSGDINHSHDQFLEDYDNGRMDHFGNVIVGFKHGCSDRFNEPQCWLFAGSPANRQPFSVVPRTEVQPYWTMARSYALGDRMFESSNGPSFASHEYMISGQAQHVTDNPNSRGVWGCDSPSTTTTRQLQFGTTTPPNFSPETGIQVAGPFPCFNYATAANLLDAARISWTYYAPAIGSRGAVWSAFDAISPVRLGTDWVKNVKSPETSIFTDILRGTLPQVAWVVPSFKNSDHAGSRSTTGPQWVASIVDAIGNSAYWQTTAIIITWDDWGGWYDHVSPQQYPNSTTGAFEGLGFRVPVIVVSPYAKGHYVSHNQHEIVSTLRFIEKTFGLSVLGTADLRADAFDDMFDFTQRPTRFKTIPTTLTVTALKNQQPSVEPPDY